MSWEYIRLILGSATLLGLCMWAWAIVRTGARAERFVDQASEASDDAAAVNTTRWALYRALQDMGIPLEVGTGGRTKWNRTQRNLEKSHWTDATCIGASTPPILHVDGFRPLLITAMGHGSRQMCQTDKYGFPKSKPRPRRKISFGFQTGDIVRAVIPQGKYAGIYVERITIRHKTPKFRFKNCDVHQKYVTRLHRHDGYGYT